MATDTSGVYQTVNEGYNTLFSVFVHWYPGTARQLSPMPHTQMHIGYRLGTKLCYKVRAVDYWQRKGPYSDPMCANV